MSFHFAAKYQYAKEKSFQVITKSVITACLEMLLNWFCESRYSNAIKVKH